MNGKGQLKLKNNTIYEYVLIALGANLPSALGTPLQTLVAVLGEFESRGIEIDRRSRWYKSAPVPVSSQDWYINGVISVKTTLGPEDLLALLHRIEDEFGRTRGERNAARVLDLDLIAYGDLVRQGGQAPELPHPRMHDRAFVLLPMADIVTDWVHPVSGATLSDLIAAIPPDQTIEPQDEPQDA